MTDNHDNTLIDDKVENYSLIRHPIFIGDSVFVITALKNKHGLGVGELFLTDYIEHRKQIDRAATDLIEQIKDDCSISFYWSLKEAIDRQIEERNKSNRERGVEKQFSFTRVEKQDASR